jgi:transcriptional accessory protein Tex/SPT6
MNRDQDTCRHQHIISREMQIKAGQVAAVEELLDDSGTVPFIARYRNKTTGLLDEIQIAAIRNRLQQLAELLLLTHFGVLIEWLGACCSLWYFPDGKRILIT